MADRLTGTQTSGQSTGQTRLNVNINSQTAAALKGYSEANEVSVTESVRRLVAVGDYIAKAQASGCDVLIRRDGETERVYFAY